MLRWLTGREPKAAVPPARTAYRQLCVPAGSFQPFAALEGSSASVLARIGRDGRAALSAHPSATALPAHRLDMFLVEDFVSADECSHLIRLINADVKPSTSLKAAGDGAIRTSATCLLPPAEPVVARVEARMAALLAQPLAQSEKIHGQRYQPGQFFKMHNDYIAGGQPYSAAFASEGGQRTWTAMVFLNEPGRGGSTKFPRAGIEVLPQRGALLTWNNMAEDGRANVFSHHEGMPVIAGSKYILTKWFREREWQASASSDALRR